MELCLLFPTHIHGVHRDFGINCTSCTCLALSDYSNPYLMANAFNVYLFYITDQSNDFRRCLSAGCNVELSIKSSLYQNALHSFHKITFQRDFKRYVYCVVPIL